MVGVSARVRIKVSEPGLANYEATDLAAYMLGLGNRTLNNARGRVNVRDGLLRQTGAVVPQGGSTVRVGFFTHYARYVHDGTRPHTISAAPGRALRFPAAGGFVFRRTVHHPGYRGNPYLTDAMRDEVSR